MIFKGPVTYMLKPMRSSMRVQRLMTASSSEWCEGNAEETSDVDVRSRSRSSAVTRDRCVSKCMHCCVVVTGTCSPTTSSLLLLALSLLPTAAPPLTLGPKLLLLLLLLLLLTMLLLELELELEEPPWRMSASPGLSSGTRGFAMAAIIKSINSPHRIAAPAEANEMVPRPEASSAGRGAMEAGRGRKGKSREAE